MGGLVKLLSWNLGDHGGFPTLVVFDLDLGDEGLEISYFSLFFIAV